MAADTSRTRWLVSTGVLRGRGLYMGGGAGPPPGVVHGLCDGGG